MKVGIVGLPQSGKKTLFQLLTGTEVDPNVLAKGKFPTGIAEIRDSRLDKLTELYNPKKKVPARIEFTVVPGIETTDSPAFDYLEQVDLIMIVVRAFESEQVFHIKGDVNPSRDVESILSELSLRDWMFMEKRLERMAKDKRKRTREVEEEQKLFETLKDDFEAGKAARNLDLSDEQKKTLTPYPILTMKNVIVVVNVNDDAVGEEEPLASMKKQFADHNLSWTAVSAQLEEEVASLNSEEEREEFLSEFGIEEPALERLTQTCYQSMGLISFFTVGEDECRGWMIRRGSPAPKAARAIHTDLEKGFIRAEVMKYEDRVELGDEKKLKELGKYQTKGKDYIVEDGDIVNILHNA